MREQLTDSNPSRVTLEKTAKKNYDKCKLRAFGESAFGESAPFRNFTII